MVNIVTNTMINILIVFAEECVIAPIQVGSNSSNQTQTGGNVAALSVLIELL